MVSVHCYLSPIPYNPSTQHQQVLFNEECFCRLLKYIEEKQTQNLQIKLLRNALVLISTDYNNLWL